MPKSKNASEQPLIAIDFVFFDHSNLGAGQYRYLVQLIRGLSSKSGYRFLVIGSKPQPVPEICDIFEKHQNWQYASLPWKTGRFWDISCSLRYSQLLKRHLVDLFHATHLMVPLFLSCPVVLTKYDLMEEIFDEYVAMRSHRPYVMHKKACRDRVNQIISISHSTHNDLVRFFDVDPEKSKVIHLAVDSSTQPEKPPFTNDSQWDQWMSGDSPWILSLYNLEPRKNLMGLCKALPAIAERYPDIRLVLFGKASWSEQREDDFNQEIGRLGLTDRIFRVGFVSDEQLTWLYGNATVFVFPSFYEGFGYPVIEAMGAGGTVVAANISSMAELLSDAGVAVDVRDPQSIAENVNALIADPDRRRALGIRGRHWASSFSVDNFVDKTFDTYVDVLNANS